MSKEEAIINMMVEYFLKDIKDEQSIKEMAATILYEDYGTDDGTVDGLASELVDELWVEADYRAEMANREARAKNQARIQALRSAVAWR